MFKGRWFTFKSFEQFGIISTEKEIAVIYYFKKRTWML